MARQGADSSRVLLRRLMAGAVLVIGVGVAAAACDANDDGDADEGVTRHEALSALLLHDREGGEEAQFAGYLRYRPDEGCLVLTDEGDENANVVVWPRDSQPLGDDPPTGVEVPGFGEVALDRWVVGNGGFAQPEDVGDDLPESAADCRTGHGEILFIDGVAEARDEP